MAGSNPERVNWFYKFFKIHIKRHCYGYEKVSNVPIILYRNTIYPSCQIICAQFKIVCSGFVGF